MNLVNYYSRSCVQGFFYRVKESASRRTTDWWIRPPYLYPPETGWSSYTPGHQVRILVASYDTHGLRWGYSCSRPPHGNSQHIRDQNIEEIYTNIPRNSGDRILGARIFQHNTVFNVSSIFHCPTLPFIIQAPAHDF